VDVTLGSVELLSRNIGTVTGHADGGARRRSKRDPVPIDRVTPGGFGHGDDRDRHLDHCGGRGARAVPAEAQTGIGPKFTLKAPDLVTVTIGAKAQAGRWWTSNGALLLVPAGDTLSTVTLIAPGTANPLAGSSGTTAWRT